MTSTPLPSLTRGHAVHPPQRRFQVPHACVQRHGRVVDVGIHGHAGLADACDALWTSLAPCSLHTPTPTLTHPHPHLSVLPPPEPRPGSPQPSAGSAGRASRRGAAATRGGGSGQGKGGACHPVLLSTLTRTAPPLPSPPLPCPSYTPTAPPPSPVPPRVWLRGCRGRETWPRRACHPRPRPSATRRRCTWWGGGLATGTAGGVGSEGHKAHRKAGHALRYALSNARLASAESL